jgi:hypothetical protein
MLELSFEEFAFDEVPCTWAVTFPDVVPVSAMPLDLV